LTGRSQCGARWDVPVPSERGSLSRRRWHTANFQSFGFHWRDFVVWQQSSEPLEFFGVFIMYGLFNGPT
jgi:hypothetical protein